MCLIRSLVLFFFVAASAGTGLVFRHHIHSPRWDVKTMQDNFVPDDAAIPTTVSEQAHLEAPPRVQQSWKRLSAERTLYQLDGQLIKAMQDLDRDYKFVLQDPQTGDEMIGEIPDPAAFGPEKYKEKYRIARHWMDSLAGKIIDYNGVHFDPPPLVRVTGIGFFDQPHYVPYHGTAPNNREIHPVLSIEMAPK